MADEIAGLDAADSRIRRAVAAAERSLSLAGLGLDTLPPALAAATALRELDLSDNSLTDLPPWFGELAALETLVLRGNRFVVLPEVLARLAALRWLDLSGNELVEIPHWLGGLKLESLELADNRHLVFPPPQIVAQGGAATWAHVRSQRITAKASHARVPLPSGRLTAAGVVVVAVATGLTLAFQDSGGSSTTAQAVRVATQVGTALPAVLSPPATQGPLDLTHSPVAPTPSRTPVPVATSQHPALGGRTVTPVNPPTSAVQTPPPGTKTATAVPVPPPALHDPVGVVMGYASMCLDDRGAITTDYNPVQEFTCNGTASQQWTVDSAGHTLRVYGKCLDVYAAGTADGTAVDLFQCNGTGAQVWIPRADGSLFNPESNKCLDDTDWSTQPGRQLQIWSCAGTANQQWTLPS